jgi:two-component system CitB family response regulator
MLRTSGGGSLPKGVSAPTLALVADVLREARHGMSAAELAAQTGISLSVARRYLKFLSDSGAVDMTARYGHAGRPEHLYAWAGGQRG